MQAFRTGSVCNGFLNFSKLQSPTFRDFHPTLFPRIVWPTRFRNEIVGNERHYLYERSNWLFRAVQRTVSEKLEPTHFIRILCVQTHRRTSTPPRQSYRVYFISCITSTMNFILFFASYRSFVARCRQSFSTLQPIIEKTTLSLQFVPCYGRKKRTILSRGNRLLYTTVWLPRVSTKCEHVE